MVPIAPSFCPHFCCHYPPTSITQTPCRPVPMPTPRSPHALYSWSWLPQWPCTQTHLAFRLLLRAQLCAPHRSTKSPLLLAQLCLIPLPDPAVDSWPPFLWSSENSVRPLKCKECPLRARCQVGAKPWPHSLPQGQLQSLLVGTHLLQAARHLGQEALQVACQLGLLMSQLPPQLPDLRLPRKGRRARGET